MGRGKKLRSASNKEHKRYQKAMASMPEGVRERMPTDSVPLAVRKRFRNEEPSAKITILSAGDKVAL